MTGTVLEKIESLRKDKTPNEIEDLLLNGKLGNVRADTNGYQYIGIITLSSLVVEAHRFGFVKCMWMHPYKYVVHHKDGNPLNNIYENLQVMKWADHIKFHRTAYIGKKHSDWFKDPVNAETIEARCKAISKTKRKDNGWITPESNFELFGSPFTRKDYAEASKILLVTAWSRLSVLLKEGQITCKKELINGSWCNVYRV